MNTKMLPKDHADHDRLHKLRPVIDFLNKTFQTVPFENRQLSVQRWQNDLKKRGRPSSSIDRNLEQKKKKSSSTAIPPKDVRTDNFGHIPNWSNTRQRCKIPGCKGFSFIFLWKMQSSLMFE